MNLWAACFSLRRCHADFDTGTGGFGSQFKDVRLLAERIEQSDGLADQVRLVAKRRLKSKLRRIKDGVAFHRRTFLAVPSGDVLHVVEESGVIRLGRYGDRPRGRL